MFDAKPEDREQIALWIKEIETDHKTGPDGTLIAFDKITFGKKGTANYEQIYDVNRLKKDNPLLWDFVRPAYEKWKSDRTIVREGLPLEAWPAITKAQIRMCHEMGLFVVEDLANATDSIRQKLGGGASDLLGKAKAFVENKEMTTATSKIASLEARLEAMAEDLKTSQATIDSLMAERGKRPGRPKNSEKAAE